MFNYNIFGLLCCSAKSQYQITEHPAITFLSNHDQQRLRLNGCGVASCGVRACACENSQEKPVSLDEGKFHSNIDLSINGGSNVD